MSSRMQRETCLPDGTVGVSRVECAAALGVSVTHVDRLVKMGRLTRVQTPNGIAIDARSLRAEKHRRLLAAKDEYTRLLNELRREESLA